MLHGITSTQYNGLIGMLVKQHGPRWEVQLSNGHSVKIKSQNLKKDKDIMEMLLQAKSRAEVHEAILPIKEQICQQFNRINQPAEGVEKLCCVLESVSMQLCQLNHRETAIYVNEYLDCDIIKVNLSIQ